MTEQELFEAYVLTSEYHCGEVDLMKDYKGEYLIWEMNIEFKAWQAGRAPLLARIAELEADAEKVRDAALDESLNGLAQ